MEEANVMDRCRGIGQERKTKMDKEVVELMYNGISLSHEINVIRLVAA